MESQGCRPSTVSLSVETIPAEQGSIPELLRDSKAEWMLLRDVMKCVNEAFSGKIDKRRAHQITEDFVLVNRDYNVFGYTWVMLIPKPTNPPGDVCSFGYLEDSFGIVDDLVEDPEVSVWIPASWGDFIRQLIGTGIYKVTQEKYRGSNYPDNGHYLCGHVVGGGRRRIDMSVYPHTISSTPA